MDHPWLRKPANTAIVGSNVPPQANEAPMQDAGAAEPHPNPRDQRSNRDPGHASARPAIDGFAPASKNAVYDGL